MSDNNRITVMPMATVIPRATHPLDSTTIGIMEEEEIKEGAAVVVEVMVEHRIGPTTTTTVITTTVE